LMAAVEASKRLPLAADSGWAFLMSPAVQRKWLGPDGAIPPTAASTTVIEWGVGVWRTGVVDSIENNRVVLSLQPPSAWQARHGRTTRVTVDLTADPKDGAAVVTITEDGFEDLSGTSDPEAASSEALRRWSKALDDLRDAASKARKRTRSIRQAVLVIHGIGEQTPGRTVRDLVQAAAEPEERSAVRSKPDRISKTFELRRWNLPGSRVRPTTDFFEVYWADKIRDTTMSQVLGWLRRLLLRRPTSIPSALKPVWWTAWLTLALAAVVVASFLPGLDVESTARWLGLAGTALLGVVSGFMVHSLGDAARYLWPHPANVAVRDRIRSSGVDLLDALHNSGRYHRIIILGHSLGSVIAHDIVGQYWIATHRRHDNPISVQNTNAARLARLLENGSPRPEDEELGSQWSVWGEMRRNTQTWLITDLITAGSPLAHAALLLAESPDELDGMFSRRELASCPPSPANDLWYDSGYIDQLGRRRTFRYLTHNAPFAATRWTNLYFPVRLGFFGDLVGGPLSDVFGEWIADRPVAWHADRWRGHTLLAHTLYWKIPKGAREGSWDHLDALRAALDLDRKSELKDVATAMPLESWI